MVTTRARARENYENLFYRRILGIPQNVWILQIVMQHRLRGWTFKLFVNADTIQASVELPTYYKKGLQEVWMGTIPPITMALNAIYGIYLLSEFRWLVPTLIAENITSL